MKRLKLLVLMALLVCVMAGVVYHASPLAPVVGGPVEIEALWEIEDTREESEEPLVTALLNHGVPMAYDKNENTFYCSLGLENGENWPQLHLTVQNAPGVTVCFSDDYTYDYCMDAIAEGYSYELMAYNDTHYSYFYIVFTGLPVVSINTDQDITIQEDTAHFSIGTAQEGGLSCESLVRLRGDGSLYETQKLGYRIAFASSRRNAMREVPGMGVQGKINLVSMAFDDTLMHDKLSWDLIAMMTDESAPFSARKTQYVELFVNNEYEGVYLMMEPIDYETEIGKASSGSLLQDALYRTAVVDTVRSNAVIPGHQTWGYELFYSPDAADQFSHLRTYIALRDTEDDAEFARLALEHIDMKSAMGYCAFLQNAGLVDNVQNNMFIWAHTENGKISYQDWKLATSKYLTKYKRFILIDISEQRLYYVYKKKCELSYSVVTGDVTKGNGTPKGTYSIRSKATDVTLSGANYSSHVNYWMAFIGSSYGIHDASWRSHFGGKIYRGNGSHGCVNSPYSKVKILYNKAPVGTPVIIIG